MGQIHRCLNKSLEIPGADLIEQNRQNNRSRKCKEQLIKVQKQGVFKKTVKVAALEQLLKMLKSYPRTSPYSIHDLEILKCNDHAIQRTIFKNNEKRKGKQKQRQ
ncbi:hypothetical protein D3C74_365320 [compost metagenome]